MNTKQMYNVNNWIILNLNKVDENKIKEINENFKLIRNTVKKLWNKKLKNKNIINKYLEKLNKYWIIFSYNNLIEIDNFENIENLLLVNINAEDIEKKDEYNFIHKEIKKEIINLEWEEFLNEIIQKSVYINRKNNMLYYLKWKKTLVLFLIKWWTSIKYLLFINKDLIQKNIKNLFTKNFIIYWLILLFLENNEIIKKDNDFLQLINENNYISI